MNSDMIKIILKYCLIITLIIIIGCSDKEINIYLTNPISIERIDEPVQINLERFGKLKFDPLKISVYEGDKEIPFQIDGLDMNNVPDHITFVLNFQPNERKKITIYNKPSQTNFQKRTQAELSRKFGYEYKNGKYNGGYFKNIDWIRVPDGHKDHDALFRYEGPGWESEKVGYRFYLDQRNRTDIFGKKVKDLVLQDIGVHDIEAKDDSYHNMQWWGMDIFKVGNSIGIGSIAMWSDNKMFTVEKTDSIYCYVESNGILRSGIKTKYFGWQVGENRYNLESNFSIFAGSRLTKTDLIVDPVPPNICTGLAKAENTEYFWNDKNESQWQYIALYGKQSLAGDDLGIAIIFKKENLIERFDDSLNYIVKLKTQNGKLTYYFLAAWQQEVDGIKNIQEFKNYLEGILLVLNNPIEIL